MTDKDKEKVLHGLNSCGFCDGIPNICEVTECPYREHKAWCVHELAHDAGLLISELLKAQESRVMTPDEVTNAPEKSVVWLELKPDDKFKNEIYPFVGSGTGWYSCYCSANTSPMFTDKDVEQYGVEFRCWTSRPTDAQREATPWN